MEVVYLFHSSDYEGEVEGEVMSIEEADDDEDIVAVRRLFS